MFIGKFREIAFDRRFLCGWPHSLPTAALLRHSLRLVGPLVFALTFLSFGQSAYFPTGILGEDAKEDNFKVEWYSKFLSAMGEPSLWKASHGQTAHAYRFLWLRSFNHPVSVRLEVQSDGSGLVTTKVGSGQGGYQPGKLITNRTRKLTREETSWVLNGIEEDKFWTLPTNPPRDASVVGLDGAQWIFEGARDGKYHIVDRWSPEKGEVHALGIMMLIDLAKLRLLYEEVY